MEENMSTIEDIVIDFYYKSLKNELRNFNFKIAFNEFLPHFKNKLIEHGLCYFDDFYDYLLNFTDIDNLKEFTLESDFICIGKHELFRVLAKHIQSRLKESFNYYFEEIQKIYDELSKGEKSDLQENIKLFDEAIHCAHQTGLVLEDIDTEWCKKEALEMYEEGNNK
jgi:hypothetical protein